MGKSYKEIIELLDCNQTTIWRNVKKYEEFGLDSLLQETRGGRNHAYMTVEEEKVFLARHLKAHESNLLRRSQWVEVTLVQSGVTISRTPLSSEDTVMIDATEVKINRPKKRISE
ncbi:transposase-like protein, ISSpn2 [Streptococcus pneumoniae]|nr:transposase-like protein, ISSpn2 [Streptococcus pneumoniae]